MSETTVDLRESFGPLPDRARAAIASQWAFVAQSVVYVPLSIVGLVSARRYADGAPGSRRLWNTFEDVELWLGLAGIVVVVVAVVLCLRWLLVAVRNVGPLTGAPPKRSPRWAAWSWFVPVVWWWVPLLVVRELWRSGDRRRDGSVGRIVTWWWVVWLASWSTTIVSGTLYLGAGEDVGRYDSVYAVDLIFLPLSIASALLSIAVIRAITARQLAALQP